jgi:hypothetical protein
VSGGNHYEHDAVENNIVWIGLSQKLVLKHNHEQAKNHANPRI